MLNIKIFQQICLDHYDFLIKKKPYANAFENWEKNNLGALIRTTPGYKRAAKSKNKAQTLVRFEDISEKTKLINNFLKVNGEPARLKDISDDELISLFIGSYSTNGTKITKDIALFIHLKVLLPSITKNILSRIEIAEVVDELVEETKTIPNLIEYVHKSELLNVNKIADSIKQSLISNIPIDDDQIADIIAYFTALALELPQATNSIQGLNELVIKQKSRALELKTVMSNLISKDQSEFRVIVNNIIDMGNFYVASVIAVETLSGDLISLSKEMAADMFPERGSIFFPTSALNSIPSKGLAFGCCVEISDREGVNKFRFKDLWEEVYCLLPCDNGLENIEQLINELKSFDLKSIPSDFWFLLPDGSLIKPKTKRIVLLSTAFQEAWWYVKNESTNIFIRERGFVSKTELTNKSTISMQSNDSIFATLKNLDPDKAISNEILNRQVYLESHIAETPINAERVIETIFAIFAQTPTLESLLSAQKNKYLAEIDNEMKNARDAKEQIQTEINTIEEKKTKLKTNILEIEASISGRVDTALQKSKTDIIKIFDEPLAQLFLNSITNTGATGNNLSAKDTNSLPLVRTIPLDKLKSAFKHNGVKLEPQFFKEHLFPALMSILAQKQLLAFKGKLSDLFISSFLNYMGHVTYSFSKLLLADEVSSTSQTLLNERSYPIVINPTEKVGLSIFQHELSLCTELESFADYPILICPGYNEEFVENVIYFDCDKLVKLTDKGMDYDEYIEEVGNEESSKKTKLVLKTTNNHIRQWYFLTIND